MNYCLSILRSVFTCLRFFKRYFMNSKYVRKDRYYLCMQIYHISLKSSSFKKRSAKDPGPGTFSLVLTIYLRQIVMLCLDVSAQGISFWKKVLGCIGCPLILFKYFDHIIAHQCNQRGNHLDIMTFGNMTYPTIPKLGFLNLI